MTLATLIVLCVVGLVALAQVIVLVLFILDPPVLHVDFTALQKALSHDTESKA